MNKSKVKSKTTPDDPAWWLNPLAEPQAELATDAAGLSSAEARSRLAKFGPNLFRDHQERPLLLQFLSRFKNPLVILLLVASAISAFTGEMTNFVIISVMVLFSVTLDFVQEHRAGKAAESLRHSVSVRARVIRDGKPHRCAGDRSGPRRPRRALRRRYGSGGWSGAGSQRSVRQTGVADR